MAASTVTVISEPISYELDAAAAATGLSKRTLQEAIAANDLIAHYSGTKPVVLHDDLHEWVESLPTTKPSDRRAA